MRLWSISLTYLDNKGLVALWRETLLAKKVLEGLTKGYKNHPQLIRFKESSNPLLYINAYLTIIYQESLKRSYKFDKSKFLESRVSKKLKVTDGQLRYEFKHLQKKLKIRNPDLYLLNFEKETIESNSLFEVIKGEIEGWEVINE